MFAVSMPNFATSFSLVESATKCLAMRGFVLRVFQEPVARGMRVGQRLLRGERFRRDDEERGLGIESRFSVSAMCVPSTLETKWAFRSRLRIRLQRLGDHHRAEVGATDADVDDVGDVLPE